MRKSVLRFINITLMCLLLAGCGSRDALSADNPEPVQAGTNDQATPTDDPASEKPVPETNVTNEKIVSAVEPGISAVEPEDGQDPAEPVDNYYVHMFDSFDDLLYAYKEAQDGHYSSDQIDLIFGYGEALLDHGWPNETSAYDVGYVYYDVNSDGTDDMVITFRDEIVDIYSYFEGKVKRFYSSPYGYEVTLYPEGILKSYAPETSDFPGTSWYSYDAGLGGYYEDFEELNGEYYSFCHYDFSGPEREEIEARLREDPNADMPVWIYEWYDELTESDYNKLLPKSNPIKLTAVRKLADVELPAGYKPRYEANEDYTEETIPEYFIYVISPDGYANLRTGPGTEYDVICQIPTGDSLEVYRESATDKKGNKWLKVAYWHPEGTSQLDGSDDPGVWETGWIAESQVE